MTSLIIVSSITPFKNTKKNPLKEEEKALNQEFSSGRIIVENTICQFTHFGALAQRFRHKTDKYDNVFRAFLAIVNPRIQQRVGDIISYPILQYLYWITYFH